jgi:hypothetical protein
MRPIQIHPEVCSSPPTHRQNLDFSPPPPDIDKPPFEVTETGYVPPQQLITKPCQLIKQY